MECGKVTVIKGVVGSFEFALLCDDGTFPNNPNYCTVIYRGVFSKEDEPLQRVAERFEKLFYKNMLGNGWRNEVCAFHHYHSTSHEVLGIYGGSAELLLGGEKGILSRVRAADVVLIPAGVAHRKISSKGAL